MRKLLIAVAVAAIALTAWAAAPPANLDKAIAAQRALVQQQPTAQRWNDLGNLLQLADRLGEARDAYDRALQLDPKLVTANYNLGLLLRQAGLDHRALDHFRQVVAIDPQHAWGWFQIGSIDEARGERRPAVRAYARAFALEPRLSFTDVNPQLVDSKLTTEALLVAEQLRPKGAEARRAYEDPHRIAHLLLPAVPAAPTPTPATAQAAAPPRPRPRAVAPPTADARVLRPQDLRPGSQVGGVSGSQGRGQQQLQQQLPSGEEPTYTDLLRERLMQQQEQEQQQQLQTQGGGPAVTTPGGVGVYVPSPRSSGQLQQRLDLPGSPPPGHDQQGG